MSDPLDGSGISEFGKTALEFRPDRSLVYTALEDTRTQVILLTYRVEDGALITDQPSAPREERTPFLLSDDGKELVLIYGDRTARYVRGTSN